MSEAVEGALSAEPVLPATGADAFAASARSVVEYLSRRTPLADWSVSRVAGGEQVHVHVHHDALIATGDRVPWDDTFCRQMTDGAAHVVHDAVRDPDYAWLPDAGPIRAYVGFPITDDGDLFGILCGVGSSPLADLPPFDADLVELLSSLLSSQVGIARAADRERRRATIAVALAATDELTGLVNRRGWDTLVADAQQRIEAFGDPVAVAVVDVDGLKTTNDTFGHAAGDDLLRRTAAALLAAGTDQDRVARYGGDEFTVLTNNVAVADLADHYARFERSLAEHDVQASLGHAWTGPGDRTVLEAFRLADASMYDAKRSRRR
ncbi:diguanylate cyclase (GGDEF)-like protein [Nocardioides aromaticivorans]|uniref:Diguanylate cyclase (GGDEF)-like protein n=1 Tax=Nocardioides aromaticivorans TaxID=200618 RepID=A0A7Y9ZF71_9ACTN|nr:sensor domain-containing diguanylate cyclase [Nocardioides aromaticivorans]NYI44292.1 diguanylate cyclase (GGDEF)-like protein [Nocardioides aromaticivorans]